ncbi:hypothetical protein ES703_47247 [subsurface metagenome]
MRQPGFQEYIRLCIDAADQIEDIKKERSNRLKLQGVTPSTIYAGMIHLLSKKKGYSITQRQIAFIMGKREASIRHGAKILKELQWET